MSHISRDLKEGDTLILYAAPIRRGAAPRHARHGAGYEERLQSCVDNFVHEVRPGRVARIGISIGYATYGQDGFAIDELMEIADQRMYEDKIARKRRLSTARVAAFPGVGFRA